MVCLKMSHSTHVNGGPDQVAPNQHQHVHHFHLNLCEPGTKDDRPPAVIENYNSSCVSSPHYTKQSCSLLHNCNQPCFNPPTDDLQSIEEARRLVSSFSAAVGRFQGEARNEMLRGISHLLLQHVDVPINTSAVGPSCNVLGHGHGHDATPVTPPRARTVPPSFFDYQLAVPDVLAAVRWDLADCQLTEESLDPTTACADSCCSVQKYTCSNLC